MPKKYRNKDVSSVGWYVASYIERSKYVGEDDANENKRCVAWENTILIKASNPDEAYEKAIEEANIGREPYENSDGEMIQFVFEGLTSLLPIYEELEHGSEIMWTEHENKAIKTIKSMVKSKSELEVFSNE
ncbi:hypothetical protein BTA51_13875 [Hahella sp. CCB-MM4]|uniref:DUF4288 domain-containing protein n=1 Tax=Hahella sp. (strain CCB-MM4) TaxID=1926491 RepID=UPI000B9C47D9|nr:DUF4288 domain-containing protein [Hahella sp. CCB-MM4]OZG72613.1 hypothetical protein BTA51_13875 [Hahella sp. CCB-MM4]